MRYDIVLYGTDTDAGAEYPAVASLVSASSWSPEALGAFVSFDFDNEGLSYVGGIKESSSGLRVKWSLVVRSKPFPQPVTAASSATDLSDFYPTAVLQKQYHYLYLGQNYPMQVTETSIATATTIAVIVTGAVVENVDGLEKLTIELTKKYPGV